LSAALLSAFVAGVLLLAFQNCSSGGLPDTLVQESNTVASLKVKLFVGTAKQSAALQTVGGNWQDIPGTSLSFKLSQDMTVDMRAMGSLSVVSGTTYASAHCGIRFVIDGTPTSTAGFGDVIVGVSAATTNTAWWTPWSTERHMDLKAGQHTISLQQTGWNGTDSGCSSDGNDYDAAKLTVEAY
jgi:hypothetical protein